MPQLRPPLHRLRTLLLLLPLLSMLAHCDDQHALLQVLFCQPSDPSSGLLKMFDDDQMFSYNFQNNSVLPWMKDFDKWRGLAFPDPSTLFSHVNVCTHFRQDLTTALEDITPEARGGTHVTVFSKYPLRLGLQNTLVCAINDVYPPALRITWRKNAEILTTVENSSSIYFALGDLSFQAYAYLNVTPFHSDVFSCEVQVAGDNSTIIEYWIPQYPVPSDLLENSLCGLGFTLGIIFLVLGCLFFCFSKKLLNTE